MIFFGCACVGGGGGLVCVEGAGVSEIVLL